MARAARLLRKAKEEEHEDFELVEASPIIHLEFEGEAEPQERPAPPPPRPAPMPSRNTLKEIHFEIDHFVKAKLDAQDAPAARPERLPTTEVAHVVVDRIVRQEKSRSETAQHAMERGHVVVCDHCGSPLIGLRAEERAAHDESHRTLKRTVTRRKSVRRKTPKSAAAGTSRGTARKRRTTRRAKRPAATQAKPATKAKRSRPKRAQVTVGEYRLYHKGNRFFFSKKSQAASTKAGAVPVYEVPEGRRVVQTRSGLPVLRSTRRKDATRKKARRAAAAPAAKKAAPKRAAPGRGSQCAALTAEGKQCRNSNRKGSKYCASHKGYQPPTKAGALARLDTLPRTKQAKDTMPAGGTKATRAGLQAQCAAVTEDGKQCKNSSRKGSKYCASHKGYNPQSAAKSQDTRPRAKKAIDTRPAVRKSAKRPGRKATKKKATPREGATKKAAQKRTPRKK